MNIKKLIKITITTVIVVIFFLLIIKNFNTIINKIENLYIEYIGTDIRQTLVDNDYRKKENYEYVKINTDTTIKNKEEVKNILYTFLDAGWQEYMVRCDPYYLNCVNDVKEIVNNENYLTDLSNYVHPFNTFEGINTSFTSSGKIKFKKRNRYTNNQIEELNEKVDQIFNENYDKSKNIRENIKLFHDYIINNTKYDTTNTTGISKIKSSTAYGVLIEGVGICSGYTDAMQLFLEKLNVKNYRISSSTHIWNLVYVEGKWFHLDLTWDDPIMRDGSNTLIDKYFLIDTTSLLSKEDNEHNFDENIYLEAKINQ